jgi:hypothetical protein
LFAEATAASSSSSSSQEKKRHAEAINRNNNNNDEDGGGKSNADEEGALVAQQQQPRQQEEEEDDSEDDHVQWSLFQRHHVGAWNGLWTTVNDMADVLDETVARTILEEHVVLDRSGDDGNNNKGGPTDASSSSSSLGVRHAHVIPVASTASHCVTCFDNPAAETRTLEVATYRPDTLLTRSKIRLASRGIVVGPKIMPTTKSMALEIGVRFGNARVRARIVMAPVWEPGVLPMSCPPHALRVAQITLHREVLAGAVVADDDDNDDEEASDDYYPTPQSEEAQYEVMQKKMQQQKRNNANHDGEDSSTSSSSSLPLPPPPPPSFVRFHRGVPPFAWHKDWRGTAWTWGPQAGDRGWQLDQVELQDQWHGNNPVERWNWRTKTVYVQLPKLVTSDETALFRMAWLADPDHLLRIEAGVLALQPVFGSNDDDDDGNEKAQVVGLEPPRLVSLRCDTLQSDDDGAGVGP